MINFIMLRVSLLALFIVLIQGVKSQMDTTLTWTGNEDNVFTNSGNWSPEASPTSAMNVVFPASMASTTIIPSGGICKNMTVNAANMITFNNSGEFNIVGSLISNGNLTFDGTAVSFVGTGTIDVGVDSARFITSVINIDCDTGTYTLVSDLIVLTTNTAQSNGSINFVSGNFNSSGHTIGSGYIVYNEAPNPRTINLSNSLVTCKFELSLNDIGNTTYANTGTRLVFDGDSKGRITIGYGTTTVLDIGFQSVTYNRPNGTPGSSAITGLATLPHQGTITMDSLILDVPDFIYDHSGFDVVVNTVVELQQHCQIISSISYDLNFRVNAINFPTGDGCKRSSLTTKKK